MRQIPASVAVPCDMVAVSWAAVVHKVRGSKTACGRPLVRPVVLSRNFAIGWYAEWRPGHALNCETCEKSPDN